MHVENVTSLTGISYASSIFIQSVIDAWMEMILLDYNKNARGSEFIIQGKRILL
jgi:hypothetical protein